MEALINKATLKTLCDHKELSANFVASKVNVEEEKVLTWLDPTSSIRPSFSMAKKIAKAIHVPFAGLYLTSEALEMTDYKKSKRNFKNFRSLTSTANTDDSVINLAVYDLLEARDFLFSLENELFQRRFQYSLKFPETSSCPIAWAESIVKIFGIDRLKQKECTSARKFYLYLRELVERKGIFVECFTGVDVSVVRGISVFDNVMPIIGLNDKDRYPAKTFSLIHELVHILKRQSTFCSEMHDSFTQEAEEIFCNAVAGELLVPKNTLLNTLVKVEKIHFENLDNLASLFSVSKEVIVRRLLDCGKICNEEYNSLTKEVINKFNDEKERQKEETRLKKELGENPNFCTPSERKAIDRTSSITSLRLLYVYRENIYSRLEISGFLKINLNSTDKFLNEVGKWS